MKNSQGKRAKIGEAAGESRRSDDFPRDRCPGRATPNGRGFDQAIIGLRGNVLNLQFRNRNHSNFFESLPCLVIGYYAVRTAGDGGSDLDGIRHSELVL